MTARKKKKKQPQKRDYRAYGLRLTKESYLIALDIHLRGHKPVDMERNRLKSVQMIVQWLGRWPTAADFADIRRPAGVHLVDRLIEKDLAMLLPPDQQAIDASERSADELPAPQ